MCCARRGARHSGRCCCARAPRARALLLLPCWCAQRPCRGWRAPPRRGRLTRLPRARQVQHRARQSPRGCRGGRGGGGGAGAARSAGPRALARLRRRGVPARGSAVRARAAERVRGAAFRGRAALGGRARAGRRLPRRRARAPPVARRARRAARPHRRPRGRGRGRACGAPRAAPRARARGCAGWGRARRASGRCRSASGGWGSSSRPAPQPRSPHSRRAPKPPAARRSRCWWEAPDRRRSWWRWTGARCAGQSPRRCGRCCARRRAPCASPLRQPTTHATTPSVSPAPRAPRSPPDPHGPPAPGARPRRAQLTARAAAGGVPGGDRRGAQGADPCRRSAPHARPPPRKARASELSRRLRCYPLRGRALRPRAPGARAAPSNRHPPSPVHGEGLHFLAPRRSATPPPPPRSLAPDFLSGAAPLPLPGATLPCPFLSFPAGAPPLPFPTASASPSSAARCRRALLTGAAGCPGTYCAPEGERRRRAQDRPCDPKQSFTSRSAASMSRMMQFPTTKEA